MRINKIIRINDDDFIILKEDFSVLIFYLNFYIEIKLELII